MQRIKPSLMCCDGSVQMTFKQLSSPPPVKPATRQKVFKFLRGLQEFRSKGEKPIDEQAIRDYLNRQSLGSLQSISSRIMMDILKSPTADPKRDTPRGKGKKKQTAPKRAAAKKKKAVDRKSPKKKVSRKK
jgi:hypothetical protein